MNSLLIVDDESIIVEGLYECFRQLDDFPYEVYKAFDGEEAMEVARRTRVDILLTDIEMPGMNGLELQKAIESLWPRCKTILLTGYRTFDYVQSSLRGGALDYVLKTEEDERVIESVRKAAEKIAEENNMERLLNDARNQWIREALPVLRREWILELLNGRRSAPESLASGFARLEIPLRPDEPVYLCIGRVDEWRPDLQPGDMELLMFCIGNIAAEHFGEFDFLFVEGVSADRYGWLMQPKPSAKSFQLPLDTYIMGTIELVQAACKEAVKLPCSFAVGCLPCQWKDLSAKYGQLTFLLAQGLGLGRETLLSDDRPAAGRGSAPSYDYEMQQLSRMMERGDWDLFFRHMDRLSVEKPGQGEIRSGSVLELFYSFSCMFIGYFNRRGLWEEMLAKVQVNKLLSVHEHGSWDEAAAFFRKLAEILYEREHVEHRKETNDVVWQIQQYVHANIGGDLSLAGLSAVVHLTPFYLSSLYKLHTGQKLIDYINETKLAKAKELLIATPLKIYEIGRQLGFQSPAYFNRFFKKALQITPQEYRENMQKG